MTPVTRPRGPLPARVYWTRRFLVLGVALALVFGIGRLLDGSPDVPEGAKARQAAGEVGATALPSPGPTRSAGTGTSTEPPAAPARRNKRTRAPLPLPTGPCADDDVKVVPAVEENTVAGSDVRLTLHLSTLTSPACNWEVSADSVVVKLTSGSDRIWSSQDCSAAVPRVQVVLRKRPVAQVDVVWSGRRSDADCSRTTQWAEPGYYHATAAALGAEPQDQQFALSAPAPPTITPKPKPTKKQQDRAARRAGAKPADR